MVVMVSAGRMQAAAAQNAYLDEHYDVGDDDTEGSRRYPPVGVHDSSERGGSLHAREDDLRG